MMTLTSAAFAPLAYRCPPPFPPPSPRPRPNLAPTSTACPLCSIQPMSAPRTARHHQGVLGHESSAVAGVLAGAGAAQQQHASWQRLQAVRRRARRSAPFACGSSSKQGTTGSPPLGGAAGVAARSPPPPPPRASGSAVPPSPGGAARRRYQESRCPFGTDLTEPSLFRSRAALLTEVTHAATTRARHRGVRGALAPFVQRRAAAARTLQTLAHFASSAPASPTATQTQQQQQQVSAASCSATETARLLGDLAAVQRKAQARPACVAGLAIVTV